MSQLKKPISNQDPYMIDKTSNTEIPSVTRLLNRKSLSVQKNQPSPNSNLPFEVSPGKEVKNLNSEKSIVLDPVTTPPETQSQEPHSEIVLDDLSKNVSLELEIREGVTSQEPEKDLSISLKLDAAAMQPSPLELPSHQNEVPEALQSFKTEDAVRNELAVSLPTPPTNTLKIQPAVPRTRQIQPLLIWELNTLKSSPDPLGQGIALALRQDAVGALFLAIQSPPPGTQIPQFQSRAIVLAPSKHEIWTGLKWNPSIVLETWNLLIHQGYVDLPPPGTMTYVASHRNVVRSAFGILPDEWLLLVRVGSAMECRGLVAFVFTKSKTNEMSDFLKFISASPRL